MYRTAIAILMNAAADAIQDTILVCWEKINTLKENKYYKTWMTRVLINKCYDILKQREKITSFEEYEETVMQQELNDNFKEMLSVLDEKYRIPMMLYYGQGYKIQSFWI